jgi:hypothetical protein
MITKRVAVTLLLALIVAGSVVSGCARAPQARFVDDDKVYTLAEVDRNAPAIAPGDAAKVTVGRAAEVRQQVLAELRRHGTTAGEAADFITRNFPPGTKAVPFYVEAATVAGQRSWVILESYGDAPASGTLAHRRLWVFDRSSRAILDARTYR